MPLLLDACDSVREFCRQDKPWRIKARVIRLWEPSQELSSMNFYSMEMILQDIKGDKMHGVVCKNHSLNQVVTEGCAYIIHGFKVIWNDGTYHFMGQKLRLLFSSSTMFILTEDKRISLDGLSFLDTRKIQRVRNPTQPLIDIMGMLTAASAERIWISDAVLQKMIAVDLQDTKGSIRVVIIGDHAEFLSNFLCSNWTRRPILALQLVRVKIEQDKLYVFSMAPVSRLFVNPTFDGALDLVDRLEAMGVRQAEPVEYIWPNEDQSHIRDEMLSLYPRKTITQLIETTEDGIFVVHAGIVGLIRDGHWSYPSCRCYAELLGLGGRFECLKCCRIVGNMQRRYRLKLEVFDGYASSIFVLHDSETRHFMNLSCEDLILNMQQSMEDPFEEDYPTVLEEKIVGREVLFQVINDCSYQFNGGECFDVMRICEDHQLIDEFHNLQLVVTPKKSIFKPKFSVIDPTPKNQENVINSSVNSSATEGRRDYCKTTNQEEADS
ncbi:uncharacterized protein LOC130744367 [Lotus japonicus]|uniref:uncharacterized protein LOC130744367 n=1 Tax=Lotus japonicus TaxID=34305 RepID=UPI00258B2B6E|nr:uncharacterized protein LOC130744367 [Lotus japonicus]